MCPAHPEHFIDSKLLTSTSLSERLRLWNKYARAPVDVDTVRLDFFRKARRGRLFQRCKVKIPLERRVKVVTDHPPITLLNYPKLFLTRPGASLCQSFVQESAAKVD
jgi:hypothetical protein